MVVIGIVNSIRKSSPCGGFIKRCPQTNRWISMSNEAAREKVGHCLRDTIASQREEQRQVAGGNTISSRVARQQERKALVTTGRGFSSDAVTAANRYSLASASKGRALNALSAIASSISHQKGKPDTRSNPRKSSVSVPIKRSSVTATSNRRGSRVSSTSRGKAYSAEAVAAATAATITLPPEPGNSSNPQFGVMNPQRQQHPKHQHSRTEAVGASFMIHSQHHLHHGAAAAAAAFHPPQAAAAAAAMADMQLNVSIASTFNNFDFTSVNKTQEMSAQQRKILALLEGGFKGSVEDLISAVQ